MKTTTSVILKAIIVSFCFGTGAEVALAQGPHLYDALPSVQVTTDNSTYEQFEPVVTFVTVTNTTAKPQDYGPTRWVDEDSDFDFLLMEPGGDTAYVHWMYRGYELLSVGRYTYAPQESRSDTINLSLAYPLWEHTGTYTLQVRFPTDPELNLSTRTVVASTSFSITQPSSADSSAVALLDSAATRTFDLAPWNDYPKPDFEAVLDSLSSADGCSSHMKEFAAYLYALTADIDYQYGERDSTDAFQRYAAFVAAHPSSEWARAAKQGFSGLLVLAGGGPYWQLEDSYTELDLHLFLEGAFSGVEMTTILTNSGIVPDTQPYSGPPWEFTNPSESLSSSADLTDWILVGLIDTTLAPDSVVAIAPAQLDKSGWAAVRFRNLEPGLYRVIVDHRNHLPVASEECVDLTQGYAEWDFTTGHALGTNPEKQIISGPDTVYAMWAGDATADGMIDDEDLRAWTGSVDATGYEWADFNMDGIVDRADRELLEASLREKPQAPCVATKALYSTACKED